MGLENTGEGAIRELLTRQFPGEEFHLMNNLTLPCSDGTTQIDHVLLSRYGVFVIETKHYAGWIFANTDSAKWTQVIPSPQSISEPDSPEFQASSSSAPPSRLRSQ
jgi:hypothetical protein